MGNLVRSSYFRLVKFFSYLNLNFKFWFHFVFLINFFCPYLVAVSNLHLNGNLVLVDTGSRQSPIDIDTSKVVVDPELNRSKQLSVVYPNLMSNLVILNTGYGWKLDIPEMIAAKTGKLEQKGENG